MLDGLLSRGFAAKCKSLIKLTKSRIDVIRRKRRAIEKFLKKDIADLLQNGLDINAYGRAEGLLVELTLSSCYGFVEKSCEIVLKHVSVMQKLSGCPEECRVAVSSLMFAAARFSDLPELRDLRKMFQERYGNSLECYVNQEFATNLNFNPSTLEKKVCLMQEIVSEFSVNWDSKAFKLRMSRSSAFAQDQNACMRNHLSDYDKPSVGKDFTQKGVKNGVLLEKSPDHANDGYKFHNGKEAVILNRDGHALRSKFTVPGDGLKPLNGEVLQKRDGHDNPLKNAVLLEKSLDHANDGYKFQNGNETFILNRNDHNLQSKSTVPGNGLKPLNGCKVLQKRDGHDNPMGHSSEEKTVEQFEDGSKLHDSWGNTTPPRDSQDTTTARKSPSRIGSRFRNNVKEPFAVNHVGVPDTDKSEKKVQSDETPKLKPCYSSAIPPPYVKPNSMQQNSTRGVNVVSSHTDSDDFTTCPSAHEKPDAASMSGRIQMGLDNSDQDWQASRHERLSKQISEKEFSIREDAREVPMIKPKSMRRKHSRSRSSYYDASNEDSEFVRKSRSRSRSRRRDESRRGLQNWFDEERYQNAEEERIIDKLLIHYSKKPSILVPEKLRKKSNSHHAHLMDDSTKQLPQNGSGDGSDEIREMVTLASRSVSLPREQPSVEVKKAFARAASFQHVHPKLPDYDDLAARFAALRGR